ncbi:MFS transporter [soil metagenome]
MIRDRDILVVYATMFLLGIAYGSSLSVTPLFLDNAHFTEAEMGTLASWFAGGIVAMSIPAGALIRRFSAKRTLILALVGYVVAVGLFGLQRGYAGASAVRVLDGATSVGAWVACETILLSRAEAKHKAFVTSLYAMSLAIGYIVGSVLANQLAGFIDKDYRLVFFFAAGVAAVALLVAAVGLRPTLGPASEAEHGGAGSTAHTLAILRRIKTACLATFSYGYFQASVILFLPIYLVRSKGVDEKDTLLMTAFFAAGMLLASNLAGRVGDRLGHLKVMTVLAAIGMTMTLGFVLLHSWTAMLGAIFVAGASLASLSPLSLALMGNLVPKRDISRANGLYNAAYALGMLVGPPISSLFFKKVSGAAMLLHLAAMWAFFVAFTVVFRKDGTVRNAEVAREAATEAA